MCCTPCGEILNNYNIYISKILNDNEHEYDIDKVLNGFVEEKKHHFNRDMASTHEETTEISSFRKQS